LTIAVKLHSEGTPLHQSLLIREGTRAGQIRKRGAAKEQKRKGFKKKKLVLISLTACHPAGARAHRIRLSIARRRRAVAAYMYTRPRPACPLAPSGIPALDLFPPVPRIS